MGTRAFISLCLLGSVLVLAGCDPEDLVLRKVPDQVKGLLTFGPAAGKGAKFGRFNLTDADVTIVSPKANALYNKGKAIEFVADVKGVEPSGPSTVEVTWTVYDGRGRPQKIGQRPREKRELPIGTYKVELAAAYKDQRVVKTLSFQVALTMNGRVTLADKTGLPDTEIVLSDPAGGEPISKSKSGKDGKFTIVFPKEGSFLITPVKNGFSFSPMSSVVKFNQEGTPIEFSATKGQIENIRMTTSPESDAPVTTICPFQYVYVRFDVTTDEKPVRAEVSLVHLDRGIERLIALEESRDDPSGWKGFDPESPMVVFRVPVYLASGAVVTAYKLRVNVFDEKGVSISADSDSSVKLDLTQCFRDALYDGTTFQEKGELDEAVKSYNVMQKIYERVESQAPFAPYIQKSNFNRALAYLTLALAKRPDTDTSLKYASGSGGQVSQEVVDLSLLGKAFTNLEAVLKTQPRDPEALLLRGLTKQLAGKYDSAQDDYTKALGVDPKRYEARELRIQTYLKSRDDKNLLKAVDDFTQALADAPDKKCLRDGRRETLKLALKLLDAEKKKTDRPQADKDSTQKQAKDGEDASAVIPLCELSKMVDLQSYLRK